MTIEMNFQDDIDRVSEALDDAREELLALEAQWEASSVETQRVRESLERLRRIANGEAVAPRAEGRETKRASKLESLEVNEDTGRPARNARKQQIIDICLVLGRNGASFNTKNVNRELERIEGEISSGLKGYTYSLMRRLDEEEGFVRKVGRGKWVLV